LNSYNEIFVCKNCYIKIFDEKLKYDSFQSELKKVLCYKCGKLLSGEFNVEEKSIFCSDCRKYKFYFDYSRHLFIYENLIKKFIIEYKYKQRKFYSSIFVREFSEFLKKSGIFLFGSFNVLINSPSYQYSQKKFDHIDKICNELSKKMKISYFKNYVQKIKPTLQQAGLTRKERLKNLKNVFQIKKEHRNCLNNKNILFIDDVFSTGTTVNECCKLIKKYNKNCKIFVLTFARGR
jgi:competence protein ComFC